MSVVIQSDLALALERGDQVDIERMIGKEWTRMQQDCKAKLRTWKLALASGCAEVIPKDERRGCDCSHRCLRGRSTRPNGGITIADCAVCPIKPT